MKPGSLLIVVKVGELLEPLSLGEIDSALRSLTTEQEGLLREIEHLRMAKVSLEQAMLQVEETSSGS
jgi:hypothetical protein